MNIFGVRSGLRMAGAAVLLVAAIVGIPDNGFAEIWTDATGSFSVEAKFIGVSGKDVLLQKADGKKINVPIARLSDASRAQAKRLYELSKSAPTSGAPAAALPAGGNMTRYQPKPRQLNFTPPTPPTIPPLKPYPENASLQQAWEHVRDEAMAGRLEVLWQAMPEDMKAFIESEANREKIYQHAKAEFDVTPENTEAINTLFEVLVTKKTFILNSTVAAQFGADYLPMMNALYDPVTGAAYEYVDLAFNAEAIANFTMNDFLTYHLPRIGAYLPGLLKAVPPERVETLKSLIVVKQTSETSGTITLFGENENSDIEIEMVLYNTRWLPVETVAAWRNDRGDVIDQLLAVFSSDVRNDNTEEVRAFQRDTLQTAMKALSPLLTAQTQQEFDLAIVQSLMPFLLQLGDASFQRRIPAGYKF